MNECNVIKKLCCSWQANLFFELEKAFLKSSVAELLLKMIHQQFEIPKNEHKVQIKFQLWLIFGAHCNLFSVCRNVATP